KKISLFMERKAAKNINQIISKNKKRAGRLPASSRTPPESYPPPHTHLTAPTHGMLKETTASMPQRKARQSKRKTCYKIRARGTSDRPNISHPPSSGRTPRRPERLY